MIFGTVLVFVFFSKFSDIYHWIGLNDYEIDGVWRWTDTDTIATFTNWHTGEPNGHTRENCAIIYPVFNYKWIDENCLARHKPLCEKEYVFIINETSILYPYINHFLR